MNTYQAMIEVNKSPGFQPRLIAQEVTPNLNTPAQVRRFYQLFQTHDIAFIAFVAISFEYLSKIGYSSRMSKLWR